MGATADEYGQTVLKWAESDKCCKRAFRFTTQISSEMEVAPKELPTNLKSEHAGSGDKKE